MSKADAALQSTVDSFLDSKRCQNLNTRRNYGIALNLLAGELGPERRDDSIFDDDIAAAFTELWTDAAPSTWNARRAAVQSFLDWSGKNQYPVPCFPAALERQKEIVDETRAIARSVIERQLSRRDIPLREKTLWRMLYETAARAFEVLALDIEDLELEARRAKVVSKGGNIEYIYWGSATAHLLPRLIRGRSRGPVFISHRRPGPARRPRSKDICPTTQHARLGYDRARILLKQILGWELHQFRHSAATHLGDQGVTLPLIMAKLRHRNPRTAARYVKPSGEAVADVTELLDLSPSRRR